MADQADVLVKNEFTGVDFTLTRKPDGVNIDLQKTVSGGSQEQLTLLSPDVLLFITAPTNMDLKDCRFKVDSATDLEVIESRTDSHWRIKIVPNDLDPETPTAVNISVADIQED